MTAPTLEAERAAPTLVPCPFCGSATADAIENQTYGGYMVMCNDCTAEGGLRETRTEAIEAWNRRTAAPVAEGVALPPLDAEGLPPLPKPDVMACDTEWTGRKTAHSAEQVRQAQRDAAAIAYARGRGDAVRDYIDGRTAGTAGGSE